MPPASKNRRIKIRTGGDLMPPVSFLPRLPTQKNSEYSSLFGEPVPTLVIRLVVELLTIALRMVVDEALGFACL